MMGVIGRKYWKWGNILSNLGFFPTAVEAAVAVAKFIASRRDT